ncbi:MAG: ion channel [Rhizobiaceae bacterium]
MLVNLLVGTLVMSLTIITHTVGLVIVTRVMAHLVNRFRWHGHRSRYLAMFIVVFGVFGVLTLEIWLWAAVYKLVGALPDFVTALYFSTITFSTVGYGDVIAAHEWRLLAALEGINGFILIGWSTAYLVAAGMRVGPFRRDEHF